ncbi:MAG: type I-E CRISPR-associated protein Cas6/Cse3/CasE [Pseudorhodoplanes sp.]
MMPDALHLSRLTLKRSAEIAPLINVLRPAAHHDRIEVDHRLLWTAMTDKIQARQSEGAAPFLWRRDEKPGRYFMLGPKPRVDSAFFEIESKPFEVRLASGDRLEFVLRVNATVDRRAGGRDGSRTRSDVAMDLLRHIAQAERAERRQALAEKAARDWLATRSEASGFALDALHLDGYRAVVITRNPHKTGRIGVFDLRGLLTVTDPAAFVGRLSTGFGRAKAFGCGLMLIRRAVSAA